MVDEGVEESHDAVINDELEASTVIHEIEDILEVRLQPNLDLSMLVGQNFTHYQHSQFNSLFLVKWACPCCKNGKRPAENSWFSMADMVHTFDQDQERLKALESIAIREVREKETKKHAKQLTEYLNFEDVDDFNNANFEERNFTSCS